jgi:site-specific DNA-methyltransferase (adenine-specific)
MRQLEMKTVHLGNCLYLMRDLSDDCMGAVITDPPYSSGGMFRGDRMPATTEKYQTSTTRKSYADFSGDNRDQRSWMIWCELWMHECLRVVRPGGVLCSFCDWRQLPALTDAMQLAGWIWRGIFVWDKTEAARPQKGRFRNQCEYVVWSSKGPMATTGDTLPGLITQPIVSKNKHHVTGKPVEVMEMICRITSGPVLDPFCGSGSTLVACERLGLDWMGMEIVPEIRETALDRIRNNGGVSDRNQKELFK